MKDDRIKTITEEKGFFKHNNFEFVEVTENRAIIKANLTENSMNPYHIVHGGLTFGLGDMAMGALLGAKGRSAVTLSANITYLKPGKGNYITAKAEIVKYGKQTAFAKCNIYNEKEELIATMDGNYFFID